MKIPAQVSWPSAFVVLTVYCSFFGGWVFGIAIAKGFWMTLGAVCIPPMAWVIVAQWIVERFA